MRAPCLPAATQREEADEGGDEAEAGAANGDGAEAAGSDEEEVIDAEVVEDDK